MSRLEKYVISFEMEKAVQSTMKVLGLTGPVNRMKVIDMLDSEELNDLDPDSPEFQAVMDKYLK